MPNRPIPGPNEKAQLIYEIMQFAATNDRILERDTPKSDIFSLVQVIMRDDCTPLRATGGSTYIQELRKSGELWNKVRPFLFNVANTCKTSHCGHRPEEHPEGKCKGSHREWQENGTRPATGPDSIMHGFFRSCDKRYGEWISIPCGCTGYKTSAKW